MARPVRRESDLFKQVSPWAKLLFTFAPKNDGPDGRGGGGSTEHGVSPRRQRKVGPEAPGARFG